MLIKLVLAGPSSILQAIPAHVYVIDWVPNAKHCTADARWKNLEDPGVHEIWLVREFQCLSIGSVSTALLVRADRLTWGTGSSFL